MNWWQFALAEGRLHSATPLIGGWLRRRAAESLAADGSPRAIAALAGAVCRTDDPRVRDIAVAALERAERPAAINAACAVWQETRSPALQAVLVRREWVATAPPELRVLTGLRAGRLKVATACRPELLDTLLAACRDRDAEIGERARKCLAGLTNRVTIDSLCLLWSEGRDPVAREAIVAGGYVAQAPPALRVLCALKTGRQKVVTEGPGEGVAPLADACADRDPVIAGRARQWLHQLSSPEAKEALCRYVCEHEHPEARAAALAGGYLPRDEYQRALFLFSTEQWAAYETLDFDRRMLRTLYDSADAPLRQRILEKLRAAGRLDFLAIVVGADPRVRAAEITASEAEVTVKLLAGGKEWAKLWGLVFELPFPWSVQAVRALGQAGWQPDGADARATLAELAGLAAGEILLTPEEAGRALPPAIRRACARVPGRVNDVAFCPVRPAIAIGTGAGKVALWNFERAEREQVLDGFARSIGRVAFAGDGTLLCGERTNTVTGACGMHGFRDGVRFPLGEHKGSLMALAPVASAQVLAAGRDGRVVLWDVAERRRVIERKLPFWARAVRVSPDGTQAALLHQGMALLALPELGEVASLPAGGWTGFAGTEADVKEGVARAAAFAPDGEAIIVGKFSGEVVACRREGKELLTDSRPLFAHQETVTGVEALAGRSVVLTAGAEGKLHFLSWPNRQAVGTIEIAGERLTSLHVSPDESFLAVGDSDASMSLWDLRPLDIPMLFARPFAAAAPMHLAAAQVLLGDGQQRDGRVVDALRYIECVLRHRFRYDIEVDELHSIKAGEFDIEIEG